MSRPRPGWNRPKCGRHASRRCGSSENLRGIPAGGRLDHQNQNGFGLGPCNRKAAAQPGWQRDQVHQFRRGRDRSEAEQGHPHVFRSRYWPRRRRSACASRRSSPRAGGSPGGTRVERDSFCSSLPFIRSRNEVPTSTCRPCSRVISSVASLSSGCCSRTELIFSRRRAFLLRNSSFKS